MPEPMATFRLDKFETDRVIAAIRAAESETSGEIRVHVQDTLAGPVYDEAAKVFLQLGMQKTRDRNGVLLFIASGQRQFAILGDSGINRHVPPDFWADCKDTLHQHFVMGHFAEGICETLVRIGEKLKVFFPIAGDDQNELANDITFSP